MDGYTLISTIETFDQTSGNITKVVARQRSKHENHELFADAILASDVGLIDDERAFVQQHLRRDIYDVMAPVSRNNYCTVDPPPGKDFLMYDIADQQSNSVAVMEPCPRWSHHQAAYLRSRRDGRCNNEILRTLYAPKGDGVNYPYFVAEDTTTQHAYVPAANYHSQTVFIDYDIRGGHVPTTSLFRRSAVPWPASRSTPRHT